MCYNYGEVSVKIHTIVCVETQTTLHKYPPRGQLETWKKIEQVSERGKLCRSQMYAYAK